MSTNLVQCTRCRVKHTEAERVDHPIRAGMTESHCPRCDCKSFYDLRPQVAWCWASGLIEIGDAMPEPGPDGGGAIKIASGPKANLKARLEVVARHGYGEGAGQLLVPGVPEADGQQAKGDALAAWLKWCGAFRRSGVVFAKEFA